MRFLLLFELFVCSVIITGCGPTVQKEYLYHAREGDTVRALTLRLTGSEKPAKLIAEENGIGIDEPLSINGSIRINNKTVIKNKGDITGLEEYDKARAKLLRYDFVGAHLSYIDIETTPEDPSIAYEKMICDYFLGDFSDTHRRILGDSNSVSNVLLACSDSSGGVLNAAEDKLLARLLNEPGDRRSKYLLGEVMRRQERYVEARDAYFGLLLKNEDDIIAELTRSAIKSATRDEMNSEGKRNEDEDREGKRYGTSNVLLID